MPDDGYAKSVLVTTEWVAEHLDDHGVVVAEVDENPDVYDEGHIRGAVKLHWRDDLQDAIERDLHACQEHRPALAMVDSAKGITNFHSPNDVIVDASMPAMKMSGRCSSMSSSASSTSVARPATSIPTPATSWSIASNHNGCLSRMTAALSLSLIERAAFRSAVMVVLTR